MMRLNTVFVTEEIKSNREEATSDVRKAYKASLELCAVRTCSISNRWIAVTAIGYP